MRFARGLLLAVTLGACAASSAEVRTARSARYDTSDTALLVAIDDAFRDSRYAVDRLLDTAVISKRVYYRPDGTALRGLTDDTPTTAARAAGGERIYGVVMTGRIAGGPTARALEFAAQVTVFADLRPVELAPESAEIPPWVAGQVDMLYVRAHYRLRDHVVSTASPAAN